MKKTRSPVIGVLFFLTVFHAGLSQDVHFTQNDHTPLLINPALAGEFLGNGRFILNYRNQWSGMTGNPYTTYAFSFDKSFYEKMLSAGIMAFQDKAGDAGMGITQVIASVASKVKTSENGYLKLGINGAWSQQSLNMNHLTWNSQFNGTVIDPSQNSGETFSNEKFSYIDLSTGLIWFHEFRNNLELTAGISAFHLSRPVYDFFSSTERLNIRWCMHADLKMPMTDKKIMLSPSVLIMMQGPYREISLGTTARFTFNFNSRYTGYYKASYLYLGAYYRYRDAIMACARINHKNQFIVGISYDMNISGLSDVSYSGGGTEVSISYIIPEKALFRLKP
jgi:type IX secretion system PorP/SprF family membrane protein